MVYCAVVGCSSTSNKKSKYFCLERRFFRFPKDKNICEKWILKCYQRDKFNIETARICSKHFSENDFERKEKLLKLPEKKWKLKRDAIPSLKLIKNVTDQTSAQEQRSKRVKKRELIKQIYR